MRKQQIIILGIVFGISLLGLIILQTSYFQTAYEVKKEQFLYSANRAMDDMVDYIRKQEEAGRLSENRNLSEVRRRGVEIDAPIYIDPKRPIAVKNDPSAVANSMLNLIDDDSEVKDVSEFVGSKFKEDNLATSISKLQQAMKERTGENYRFAHRSIFQNRTLYGGSSIPPPKSCFFPEIRSQARPQPASKWAV